MTDDGVDIEELQLRVSQLETTAREAHVHLRDRVAARDEQLEAQQAEIDELRDELEAAREELRRMEQEAVRIADDGA